MPTLEQGFADAERAAAAAVKSANEVAAAAKRMQKVAQTGDIGLLRRAVDRLALTIETARQQVANAGDAWPFTPDAEEAYFRDGYEAELLEAATRAGLQIQRRDASLQVFPSVIRILPGERAVRVDKRRLTAVRPSRLVATLKANQAKKLRPSEPFLKALFRIYSLIVGRGGLGRTVPLMDLYEVFTSLPRSNTEYDKSDFGRDVLQLDRSGLTSITPSGPTFTLVAPPAGANASRVISFVAPEGGIVTFYGIRFTASSS